MDVIFGLKHWLDQAELRLEPSQKRKLMQQLATGLRKRFSRRIFQQLDTDNKRFIPRKRQQIGRIKKEGALFKKIGKGLKTEYSDQHAKIGFGGQYANIARVHQEGKTIRPGKLSRPVAYPVRKLVGFSTDDELWITSEIEKFLNDRS